MFAAWWLSAGDQNNKLYGMCLLIYICFACVCLIAGGEQRCVYVGVYVCVLEGVCVCSCYVLCILSKQ